MPNFISSSPATCKSRSREKSVKSSTMTSRGGRSREKFSDHTPTTLSSPSRAVVPVNDLDNEKLDSMDAVSARGSIEGYLATLYQKSRSRRVDVLTGIIKILSTTVKTEFVRKEFATLLYRMLHCIKKGSSQEVDLAANALGLLALTNNCQDNAHEQFAESIPVLTKGINSRMKTSSILNSLAVVTFFCSNNCVETEQTMQVIWSFIQSKFGTDFASSKYPVELLNDAIYAWSFLLASLDGWRVSYKYWQGGISYFIDLLQQNDEAVCVAAAEALALIFESGNIDKFLTPDDYGDDNLDDGVTNFPGKFSILKERMSNKVLNQLEKLSKKANWDVLKYFKNGRSPQIRLEIGGNFLNLSTWSQKIQMNFLKRFLGDAGFLSHMKENEVVQNAFEFRPKKLDHSRNDLYESTPEKVVVRLFMPPVRDPTYLTRKEKKDDEKWNIDVISKGQTIIRRTNRLFKMRNNDWESDGCLRCHS